MTKLERKEYNRYVRHRNESLRSGSAGMAMISVLLLVVAYNFSAYGLWSLIGAGVAAFISMIMRKLSEYE